MENVDEFYPAQICENGHVVNAYGESPLRYCEECGAPILSNCPECGYPLKGMLRHQISYMFHYSRPSYCGVCGKPLPWVLKAKEEAHEILALGGSLSADEKQLLYDSVLDLITDTPKSRPAQIRWQRFLAKAEPQIREAFKQLFINVVSDAAAKVLFGA